MANRLMNRVTAVELVPDGSAADGAFAAVNATGARGIIIVADAGGTPGEVIVERSVDGENWEAMPVTTFAGTVIDTGAISEDEAYTAQCYDGPLSIRARIPVAWVGGAPEVRAWIVR